MIKAAGRLKDGRPMLLLGLSGENMTLLMAQEPIIIETEQLGLPPMFVVVVGGRTEDDIDKTLNSLSAYRSPL
jgi:hypothetical protein